MISCPTIRDLGQGAVVVGRETETETDFTVGWSRGVPEEAVEDERNWARMRMERGRLVRILAPNEAHGLIPRTTLCYMVKMTL